MTTDLSQFNIKCCLCLIPCSPGQLMYRCKWESEPVLKIFKFNKMLCLTHCLLCWSWLRTRYNRIFCSKLCGPKHDYCNFLNIRRYFLAQIWPLRLIAGSAISVNKIWHASFSEEECYFECMSISLKQKFCTWQTDLCNQQSTYLQKLDLKQPLPLIILSAYGSIYLNWKILELRTKHTLTSYI